MSISKVALDRLIDMAFMEDFGSGDLSTDSCVDRMALSEGQVVAKQDLVVAGIQVFSRVFWKLDPQVKVDILISDGDFAEDGSILCRLSGPTRSILTGERVALNFLMRLSGIATYTRRVIESMGSDSKTRVVDTRKTTPGWRHLEKAAVRVGGGHNHRFGLSDGIIIKENHIVAAGSIRDAVQKARAHSHHLVKVEVETTNLDEVQEAIAAKADVIMLDNMDDEMMAVAMDKIRGARDQKNQVLLVEASGNMTPDRLRNIAELGIDLVSMGALTHSAPCVDVSLRLTA